MPRKLALGLLMSACVAALVSAASLGDYPSDGEAAIEALAHGHLGRAMAAPFLMGPLSIVLRAPFVWVADRLWTGELPAYRAGVVPCLIAAALLGLALSARRDERTDTSSPSFLVAVLAVLSPPALAAVQNGHPEEALAGALSVASVLLAMRGRPTWAGIALGLAVATKQWALLSVVPTALAAAANARLRLLTVGVASAAAFYLPFVAGNPRAFWSATKVEAHVVSAATPETVWLLASHQRRVKVEGSPILTYHAVPHWVPPLSHALIVAIPLPLAFVLRRRMVSGAEPLALLALFFLLRCVLDPVDQDYFHLPLLLALLAWEVRGARLVRGVPLVTLAVAALLWLTFAVSHRSNPWLTDALYLAWTSLLAAQLASSAGLVKRRGRSASPRAPGAVPPRSRGRVPARS